MQAGIESLQCSADRRIESEFVAAGMHAEFQRGRERISLDSMCDDCEVVTKLLLKLRHVADVIDALIETTGELGGDGLDRYTFIGERAQDDQQLQRGLRVVSFIH